MIITQKMCVSTSFTFSSFTKCIHMHSLNFKSSQWKMWKAKERYSNRFPVRGILLLLIPDSIPINCSNTVSCSSALQQALGLADSGDSTWNLLLVPYSLKPFCWLILKHQLNVPPLECAVLYTNMLLVCTSLSRVCISLGSSTACLLK